MQLWENIIELNSWTQGSVETELGTNQQENLKLCQLEITAIKQIYVNIIEVHLYGKYEYYRDWIDISTVCREHFDYKV